MREHGMRSVFSVFADYWCDTFVQLGISYCFTNIMPILAIPLSFVFLSSLLALAYMTYSLLKRPSFISSSGCDKSVATEKEVRIPS